MAETTANAAQIEAWNTRTGERWVALQARIDALFAPLTDVLVARADPRPGNRVLDIGCGCGATVLALARAVGPHGHVLGVDVSRPMLDLAASRIAEAGLANARLVLADAASHAYAIGGVDLAISRFGVMFFDDPVAAFGTIRRALAPGGRLVFACWRPLADNPWFQVPVDAIRPLLGAVPPTDPDAPGPFGFARPGRARSVLAAAGWSAIEVEPHDVTIRLAGRGEVESAADFVTSVGAAARLLAEVEPQVQAAGRAAIVEALRAAEGPDGVALGGAVWLVSARA